MGSTSWGVLLTHCPSAPPLAGRTLRSEALARGMSTWLLVCTWLGLGVPVPGEGGGEGISHWVMLGGGAAGQGCPLSDSMGEGLAGTVRGPVPQGPA